MANDLTVYLSPTQSAFCASEAEINIFIGPMGEGKTHAGVFGMIAHAARCGKNIRAALIRDTHQNIKTSTVASIQEILGSLVTFHDDFKKMKIHSTPKVECDLFGIDDPASLSKLQGPEYACIWLEEPAPIVEKINAGLSIDVFYLAVARAARQKGTRMRVQITQNPADEDHWTAELAAAPEIFSEDPVTGAQIRKAVFRIPYGENRFLNEHTRAANIAAFQNDPGKYARYVEGREAPVQLGSKVATGYDPKVHLSDTVLEVAKGGLGVRMWDAWHNPVCIIGQFLPPGRLIVHEALVGEGMGIRELIRGAVIPKLATPKYFGRIVDWRDIGDPSMRTPDQSSVTQRTSQVLEELLKTRFEPAPMKWEHRFEPMNSALLDLLPGGGPKILLSKSAYDLHRAMNGGWHWKTDNSGHVIGNVPEKDRYSHYGDAFSYGVSVLFPYARERKVKKVNPEKAMKRARSYAGGHVKRGTGNAERGIFKASA